VRKGEDKESAVVAGQGVSQMLCAAICSSASLIDAAHFGDGRKRSLFSVIGKQIVHHPVLLYFNDIGNLQTIAIIIHF
jgi:hypothetical protein